MTGAVALMIVGVLMVLVYEYTNGLQDAANMLATIVASRAATPIQAAILVSFFTFLGPLLGGTAVANTIGNFVDVTELETIASLTVVLAGIAGATGHLTGVTKVLGALLFSPILGFLFGWVTHRIMSFALRGARPFANRYLRGFQWLATAALAFSHGTNDAQKGMGIIAMLLVLGGVSAEFYVPLWVILASATTITLGTLAGGWRIVRTLGFGIYKVRPIHALDAQITSAGVILAASAIGGPVSTTQVVSSAIMGIGLSLCRGQVRYPSRFTFLRGSRSGYWDDGSQSGTFSSAAFCTKHWHWLFDRP